LDAAEEAEDYNISIVKKDMLPLFGRRAYVAKALAGLETKYDKGDRSEETTKRIIELRQEFDNINSQIGQIRKTTAAELAWMKKKEPAYYNDFVKDSEIIVMNKNGQVADEATQVRVKNELMPVLENAEEVGRGTIEIAPETTIGTQAQVAPVAEKTPLVNVADNRTWVQNEQGEIGTISRNDIGEYVFIREDGTEQIIPVVDKTEAIESIEELGFKIPSLAPLEVRSLNKLRWDAGMRKIDRILNRPDSKFNAIYNKMLEGEALTEQEKIVLFKIRVKTIHF
jgi:hypothetical protein